MVRAQVCLVVNRSSGSRHLKLIKVSRDKLAEIEDQEAAYMDVTGQCSLQIIHNENTSICLFLFVFV